MYNYIIEWQLRDFEMPTIHRHLALVALIGGTTNAAIGDDRKATLRRRWPALKGAERNIYLKTYRCIFSGIP